MSSALRKLQRKPADKPRTHRKKGPARTPSPMSQNGGGGGVAGTKGNKADANPSCKKCYGTGSLGHQTVKKHRRELICPCTARAPDRALKKVNRELSRAS